MRNAREDWQTKRKTKRNKDKLGGRVIQWGKQKSLLLSEISWIDEPFIRVSKDSAKVTFIIDIHLKNGNKFTHETDIEPKTKLTKGIKKWYQFWLDEEYEIQDKYITQDYFNDTEHLKDQTEQYQHLVKYFRDFNNE